MPRNLPAQVQEALDRTIEFAKMKVPAFHQMSKFEPNVFQGSVTVKAIRLYGQRGCPELVQVLVGRRWYTVIRGVTPSVGSNFAITARGIKSRIRKARSGR